jgi:hypothetical protein
VEGNEIKIVRTSPSLKNWAAFLLGGGACLVTGLILAMLEHSGLGAAAAAAGLGAIAWASIASANTHYTVTNRRLVVEKGLKSAAVAEADIRSISGARVFQTPLQQAFGVGDVAVDCGGGGIVFAGVEDPEKLCARILSLR